MPRDNFHDGPSWPPTSMDMAKMFVTQEKPSWAAPNQLFTSSSDKPTWNHSDKADYPWIRGSSTETTFSKGNLHTGIMKDKDTNAIDGVFAGVANEKYGSRFGAKPFTPEGSKLFAETSAKLNKKTTAYGGMRRTDD